MLIPLGTDRPLSRTTVVTYTLVGVNVLLYVLDSVLRGPPGGGAGVDPTGPLGNALSLSRHTLAARPWTLLGYAFAHAGAWHILGNMLVLWVFGPNVEDRLGRVGFLIFYLLGAAASGASWILLEDAPVVGASGAIAAVTGAYAVLFPKTTIRCFFFFGIFSVIQIPALWFIGFAVFRDIIGLGMSGNVAREAHIGGYIFGWTVAFTLLATRILPREPYDMFQMFRQSRRRAELRAAVEESQRNMRTPFTARKGGPPPTVSDEALGLRAQVTSAIASGDLNLAGERYRDLIRSHASVPPAILLSRQNMLLMANHFFVIGDHQQAALTYQRFVDGYPSDPELGHIKLMLGLIHARYLNQRAEARALIVEAAAGSLDEQHAELAKDLLAEIDAPASLSN